MTALPRVSRFLADHPKTSRFVFRLAHLIPVLDRHIPIAPPFAPAYNPRRGGIRAPSAPAATGMPHRAYAKVS